MTNIINMPNTKQVQLGNLTLQLRLDGKAILMIEKRLNKSLMGLFLGSEGGFRLPPSNELLIVIQGANKLSGITEKALVESFYEHLENGGSTMDLQEIVQELLDESGFFDSKKEDTMTDGESEQETNILDSQLMPETDSIL